TGYARLGIWHITEDEHFFLPYLPQILSQQANNPITHPYKRLQHFAGRYLLTQICPSFPLEQITVLPSRKPVVPGLNYFFSIAHSRDYVAAIVSQKMPVGIDIEHKNPVIERIAVKFLSPEELSWIEQRRRLLQLTLCWAAKEAIYKWYGLGGIDFRRDIRLFPFRVEPPALMIGYFRPLEVRLEIGYEVQRSYCMAWTMAEKP
ncbi:MAG: 4'-phosphopantetheinyl transferase superfamily protein, partial [Thermoflavifilum sp.]|nr:4'-phosphopantetheinyl transferase superfamily protein [Thermoflavifilum sp.]